MTAIKYIPTEYSGLQFRSRLEARWAVFFDTLGVEWRYEHEGYQLPSGWYLPDFWLPRSQVFVEIKGTYPTGQEQKLASELGEATKQKVVIMNGDIGRWLPPNSDHESGHLMAPNWDNGYAPTICHTCGVFGFEYECRAARLKPHYRVCYEKGDDRGHSDEDPRIIAAVEAANRYQFQFQHRPRR